MRYFKCVFLLATLFSALNSFSQENLPSSRFVTFFNNATAMPFSGKLGVFHVPVHPGFSIGAGMPLNKSHNHQLFQNFRAGYFFHRFVQHGVQLYTESGFREKFNFGLGLEFRLGAGYLHSFPHTQIFIINKDGVYEKKAALGRAQAMFSAAFGPSYDLEKFDLPLTVFIDYQLWFQYPFVNSYIPVLPNISLHAGVAWRVSKN